jgi:hypothetical protein
MARTRAAGTPTDASTPSSVNPGDPAAAEEQLQAESQAVAPLRNPRRRRRNPQNGSVNGSDGAEHGTTRQPRKRSRIASDQFAVSDGHRVSAGSVTSRKANGALGGNGVLVDGKEREVVMRSVSGPRQVDSGTVLVSLTAMGNIDTDCISDAKR